MNVSEASVVAPDGWVTDPLSLASMSAAMERASLDVGGIVAEPSVVPPGSSYRVVAERRLLGGAHRGRELGIEAGRRVRGAVLVRNGVAAQRHGDEVEVHGPLVVDPRAVTFDPWAAHGELEVATSEGRPPFPRRPLVLFLGFEEDPDLADWVRATVNALVRGDTEGRIAVPRPTDGLHLTGPCRPVAASVAALAPDVIVALDEHAESVAGEWLGDANRLATVVRLTEDTATSVELVSWQVARSHGRLRARIGRGVDADTLAALARRLCAGPQPIPPSKRSLAGVSLRIGRPRRTVSAPLATTALVGRSPDARTRFAGLAEQARATGVAFASRPLVEASWKGDDPGVLILRSADHEETAQVERLVAARQEAGLASVIDLGPLDLEDAGELTDRARSVVRAAGRATAASPSVAAAARRAGARAMVVPSMLGPERVMSLLALASTRSPDQPRLGWHTGVDERTPTPTDLSVASLVGSLLDRLPELQVDVVGGVTRLAASIGSDSRIHVQPGSPHTRVVRGWTAQIWSPSPTGSHADGDLHPVIEGQLLSVPTAVDAANLAALDGLVPAPLAMADPNMDAVEHTLLAAFTDPSVHADLALRVRRLASGLYGPTSIATTLNRLVGWLAYGETG